jgi:large subunit ribosomal protein L4
MKTDLYNQKAEKVGSVDLSESLFNSDVNDKVLAQYVYIYRSNQRQSTANTKNKAEVRGGGKKPWKQKGTGRARAGSSRSPIWRGGGVTHGPTSDVNWKRKTTKSFRRSAFESAFSKVNKADAVKVIDQFQFDSEKALTKQALDLVKSFGAPKKLTIVSGENNKDLINSFSNLDRMNVVFVNELNPYTILNAGMLLVDQKALEYINKNWSK